MMGSNEYTKINFRFLHHHDIEDERKPYYGKTNLPIENFLFLFKLFRFERKCSRFINVFLNMYFAD